MARMETTIEIKLRELKIQITDLERGLGLVSSLIPCDAKNATIVDIEKELAEKKAEAARLEEDM